MNEVNALPTQHAERADILDVLRGFAILGILLDNIFGFTGYGFFSMKQREALPTFYTDIALGLSELAFVHGKFYSMLSLLFGIGFSIILIKSEAKGISPYKIFYRRLLILLLIGAGHLFLFWEGDILFLYAIVGFVLPLFKKCSDKALLVWAVALIASPILIDILKLLLHAGTGGFLEEIAQGVDKKNAIPVDDSFAKYLFTKKDGWQHWRNWQASGYLYRYAYIIESNRIPKVLGMFLLGLYAGRNMMYKRLDEFVPLFKKLRLWGFIVGIPCSLAMAYFEIDGKYVPKDAMGLLDTVTYAISVVPLSLAYVSSICLFWVKTNGHNKWRVLQPVGRMALSNYLSQTIICIIIFYGVGFGLGGKFGPSIFIPISLVIYIVQIIFSNWWLSHFNYGPIEWVWRQFTYGKRLPLIKNDDATGA